MAHQAVVAPQAAAPLYSLVLAAPAITGFPMDVWGAGFVFAPEGCGNAGRASVDCLGGTPDPRTPAANPAQIDGDPFLVWASDQCSALGWQGRDYNQRAERQLLASESFQIAEELWGGELAQAEGLANRYLTDVSSDTVTTTAVDPKLALARLVRALGAAGHGQFGMIHMTPDLLVLLASDAAIYRDGGVWRTPMGHRVVADDGYDGTGPGGTSDPASTWMYATSTIAVGRSEVEIPGTFADNFDRDVNTVRVYAQRLAMYEWTSECAHFAAETNIPAPLVGPPS